MSRIFLSYSSSNDLEAVALRDWLAGEGWDDVFLDFDPNRGIVAGQRWERRLTEAASRCEAVVFLLSAHWLASGWCLKEYTTARRLNKKLFAVLVDPATTMKDLPPELTDTWQVTDLAGGRDMVTFRAVRPGTQEERDVAFNRDGLTRLKRGLQKAGLDARFFAWPPAADSGRAPYRGLKPLEAEDAGIFFGRDAPIVEAVDRLHGLGTGAPPRLLVVLGASGAGKSSFLRAGLLPRLARDDTHFVVLPPIRPERAALTGETGLLRTLELACPGRKAAEIGTAVEAGAAGLRSLLAELVGATFRRTLAEAGTVRPPAVMVAIDQAEELFRAEGAAEAQQLLELVRELTSGDDPVAVIVVFAIRSDSYDALEHAKPLEGLRQEAIPLLPMPRGAYKEVIEGPALRVTEAGGKLAVEPQLTERLLEDVQKGGGSDALPLLAFTLEQLHREHGGNGVLKLADYEAGGGVGGAIEAAVVRAFARADADPRIPRERAAREALLRRGLIPWLAGIDPETRSPRRDIARLANIPAEAAPLIELLVEERLLSTDVRRARDPGTGAEAQVRTIEPTHEALLRQWGLLEGWLAADFGLLATLEGVQRGARDWDANGRDEAWLAHGGGRLAEAQGLDARPDIAGKLDATDRAYIAACRAREDAAHIEVEQRRREREAEQERRVTDAQALTAATRRTAQRTRIGLVAALVLAVATAGFGLFAKAQKTRADQKTVEAEAQRDAAGRAETSAKQQTTLAQAAKKEADQRAGLLASDVAQSYIAAGDLDGAALLLIQASQAFDDANAPDKLRIALSQLVDRQAKQRIMAIPEGSDVIDTDEATFIKNDITGALLALDDAGLRTLIASSESHGPIVAVRRVADGSYVIARGNGTLEALAKDGGAPRQLVDFPAVPDGPDRQDTWSISPEGLAMRADVDKSGGDQIVDLFDTASGAFARHKTTLSHPEVSILGRKVYLHDEEDYFLIAVKGRELTLNEAHLSDEQREALRFADCLAKMPDGARAAATKYLGEQQESNPSNRFSCRGAGRYGVVTSLGYTSSGVEREDQIFNADGKGQSLDERLKMSPGNSTKSFAIDGRNDQIAGLRDRVITIASEKPSDDPYMDHVDPAPLKARTLPDAIRFLPTGELAVVEARAGRVTFHQVLPVSTPVHEILAKYLSRSDHGQPAQFGGCFGGYAYQFQPGPWTLQDGRTIAFSDYGADPSANVRKVDIVVRDKTRKVLKALQVSARCLALSHDFETLVTADDRSLSVHTGFLDSDGLGKAAGVAVPVPDLSAIAFTADHGRFVTANESEVATLWKPDASGGSWTGSALYVADSVIVHAETDPSGTRLLIIRQE